MLISARNRREGACHEDKPLKEVPFKQEALIVRELQTLADQLRCPLTAEHDVFECIWTARIGEHYGCGLDEADAYVSLYNVIGLTPRSYC
jgi:hypothetical protein